MGFFVVVLKDPTQPTIPSAYVILTGLGTAISMFISGLSGSYLSERAEQKKSEADLQKAMGIVEREEEAEERIDIDLQANEIEKAMLKPVKLTLSQKKEKKERKIKTLHHKAESFAGIIVAIVNGGSPFLGGLVPLIPFFIVASASVIIFIVSFIIIVLSIVLLGIFLGRISKESIIKNILQMLFAFVLTMVIIIIFLG
ncbi:MAG: VIT1/CCC1 transporter family protein [Candidatus Lokiarchaeota archaeon]|nr:VIT1/CCC1 transporter family protein [Candidatus Lokiarchaeota archaeon]